MTADRGMFDELTAGCPVFTPDGDQIGEVKEVRGRFFKVDAPMQPDYWLTTDCIRSAVGGRVLLAVDKEHLDDFKLSAPDERA
jgi:hypothetical protein